MTARGHVWLVGAGPGDPGLITRAGLEALRRAEVVLYDRLAPAELLDEAPEGAPRIDAGKAAGSRAMTQDAINAALVEHAGAGRRVVRLKGGDPFVFGRGGEEALALAAAGVSCTVIPGVSSAIGGLAAAGIPVTHRGVAVSFAVVTGHEDPTKERSAADWAQLATAADTLVVLMGVERLETIAQALIAGGRDAQTPAALVQQAATPRQRVVTAPLARIAEEARTAGIAAPALFVVGDVVDLQPALSAAAGPLAGLRVLVTRTRAQASTLAALLRAEGAWPVLLPAIELQSRADPAAVDATLWRLRGGDYAWAVFSSPNAVNVYLDLLSERDADARVFSGTRICAIGVGTADALAARGLIADLVPDEAVGEALVDALGGEGIDGRAILLPRAEGARETVPAGLRAAGAEVDELTLYVAAPPADVPAEALALIREGAIDAVAFTSSSTVRNLATVLGDDCSLLRDAVVVCIGPSTAETAREAGLLPFVAETHSVAGLVDALRDHFALVARGEVAV